MPAPPRHGENGNAVSLRHRVGGQHRGYGDRLIEIVRNNKPIFCKHRIIGRGPAGHARGMRGRSPLARARAADLGDNDGLAGFRGAPGGGDKFLDIANALDEQQDHVG